MTGPVLVPREESDAAQVVASNWSGPGGIKWRAGQPRPADGHPTGRVSGDVGSVDSVPSPPARDRLTSIAIFGPRPQYLFWQVWNFLGGGAYIHGPSASRAPTASSRRGRLPHARHSDLISATPERDGLPGRVGGWPERQLPSSSVWAATWRAPACSVLWPHHLPRPKSCARIGAAFGRPRPCGSD